MKRSSGDGVESSEARPFQGPLAFAAWLTLSASSMLWCLQQRGRKIAGTTTSLRGDHVRGLFRLLRLSFFGILSPVLTIRL
ncbi:unnamed protein product [Arctogadus glacialis]